MSGDILKRFISNEKRFSTRKPRKVGSRIVVEQIGGIRTQKVVHFQFYLFKVFQSSHTFKLIPVERSKKEDKSVKIITNIKNVTFEYFCLYVFTLFVYSMDNQ